MAVYLFEFEWDPAKARTNFSKHGVDFESAAEVFRDPLAISIPDEEHSILEARWITIGTDTRSQSFLVVHTFEEFNSETARIRIISARRPTKTELIDYEDQQ